MAGRPRARPRSCPPTPSFPIRSERYADEDRFGAARPTRRNPLNARNPVPAGRASRAGALGASAALGHRPLCPHPVLCGAVPVLRFRDRARAERASVPVLGRARRRDPARGRSGSGGRASRRCTSAAARRASSSRSRVARLGAALREAFDLRPREATVEANPATLDRARLEAWVRAWDHAPLARRPVPLGGRTAGARPHAPR